MAKMVFMMGLPGAGKTTVRTREYPDAIVLDADDFKTQIPGYTPERAPEFHAQSADMLDRAFLQIVAQPTEGDALVVIDGTGTTSEALVQKITLAKAMGWTCELMYVRVSLATSLARVNARAIETGRIVPEIVVRQKGLVIETSFSLVAPHVDSVRVVAND